MSNRRRFLSLLLPPVLAGAAHAQVGHDPARSPFRDITTQQSVGALITSFRGNRTEAGVGWREGTGLGVQFATRLSPAMDFTGTFVRIASSRGVANVTDSTQPREGAPLDATLLGLDIGLALNLTGPKTWRGLAPYVSMGAGFLFPTNTVQDRSGYKAGSNFYLVPALGARWYATRRVALRLEVRDLYFRYEWPRAFFVPSDGRPPLIGAGGNQQWTHNASFSLGISYAFTF